MATQWNQCAALVLLALVAPVGSLYAKGDLLGDQVLEEGIAPWQEIGDTVWPNTVAICAIMRDENPEDIRQWLRYHKCALLLAANSWESKTFLLCLADYAVSCRCVSSQIFKAFACKHLQ